MKKHYAVILTLLMAVILFACAASDTAYAHSGHSRKGRRVVARFAACQQNGVCIQNGCCDVNGICQNGGYCAGSLCLTGETRRLHGSDCPNGCVNTLCQDGVCLYGENCPNGCVNTVCQDGVCLYGENCPNGCVNTLYQDGTGWGGHHSERGHGTGSCH